MGNEDKVVRKRKKRSFRIIMISAVIIYLMFRTVPGLYASNQKTYTVESGVIEISETTKGIIIKDEQVYRSDVQGQVSIFKDEGDRLGIGDRILEVSTNGKTPLLEEELRDVEKKIEDLSETSTFEGLFKDDIDKSEKNINQIISQIRASTLEGKFEDIHRLKEQLNKSIIKLRSLTGEGNFVEYSIENLNKRKNEIIDQIEGLSRTYYADKTGIITFKIDGLEEVFSSKKILEYTPDDFKIIQEQPINLSGTRAVNSGTPIYKITDNYNWYVITKLDKKSLKSIEEGKDVYIKFIKDSSRIKAKIQKVNLKGDQALVVLKFKDYLYRFLNDRYVDIEIIKSNYEGLKVPHSAIVKKDGIEGVFIQDISNIVKFRPINILGEDDEFAIVDEGQKNNIGERGTIEVQIGDRTEVMYTITMFDKVLIYGDRVKEGDIINW